MCAHWKCVGRGATIDYKGDGILALTRSAKPARVALTRTNGAVRSLAPPAGSDPVELTAGAARLASWTRPAWPVLKETNWSLFVFKVLGPGVGLEQRFEPWLGFGE